RRASRCSSVCTVEHPFCWCTRKKRDTATCDGHAPPCSCGVVSVLCSCRCWRRGGDGLQDAGGHRLRNPRLVADLGGGELATLSTSGVDEPAHPGGHLRRQLQRR